MNCPKCGKPMGRFEMAFLSHSGGKYIVWLGTFACGGCDIFTIRLGPDVPEGMDPESYREGLRMGSNHYCRKEV